MATASRTCPSCKMSVADDASFCPRCSAALPEGSGPEGRVRESEAGPQGFQKRLAAALAHRYTVEGELGRGGMATVYLAEDRKHGRKIALEVMLPELAASLGGPRFLREIQTAAKLRGDPRFEALLERSRGIQREIEGEGERPAP